MPPLPPLPVAIVPPEPPLPLLLVPARAAPLPLAPVAPLAPVPLPVVGPLPVAPPAPARRGSYSSQSCPQPGPAMVRHADSSTARAIRWSLSLSRHTRLD